MSAPPTAIEPVTLTGSTIRLEPLAPAHLDALAEIGLDPELWRWIGFRLEARLRRYADPAGGRTATAE